MIFLSLAVVERKMYVTLLIELILPQNPRISCQTCNGHANVIVNGDDLLLVSGKL